MFARPEPGAERRAEPRVPAAGRVRLRCPDLAGQTIEGVLRDLSAHGFRAAHDCPGLGSGQSVLFQHEKASGRARVVWTRIAGGRVESGFCYLNAGRPHAR